MTMGIWSQGERVLEPFEKKPDMEILSSTSADSGRCVRTPVG